MLCRYRTDAYFRIQVSLVHSISPYESVLIAIELTYEVDITLPVKRDHTTFASYQKLIEIRYRITDPSIVWTRLNERNVKWWVRNPLKAQKGRECGVHIPENCFVLFRIYVFASKLSDDGLSVNGASARWLPKRLEVNKHCWEIISEVMERLMEDVSFNIMDLGWDALWKIRWESGEARNFFQIGYCGSSSIQNEIIPKVEKRKIWINGSIT